jgi:GGDEF domain-containing protein
LVKTLVSVMRQQAHPGDVIGRLDSSEVAIMLAETGRSEAEPIGQKIRKSVEWNFTISGGIACLPRDTRTRLAS